MEYPDYDTLREEYEAENITAVDFVTQQSQEMTEDYELFCKEHDISPKSESSAIKFMAYRDAIFEESISE